MSERYDCIIAGGLVIDGAGGAPVVEDVAIRAGRVAARGAGLDRSRSDQIIDAQGLWVMPGLLDIHTHLDLEVEFDPALEEAVRHGTTTVLMSNCSIGLAYGNQRRNGEDPLVDCFARVENMPKPVLRKVADKAAWTSSAGYYAHLDELPLGCNVIPMIPHSMLRIEVMGLNGAVTRKADEDDLNQMESLLEKAMTEGYPGFSTDALPFHFLSEDPNRRVKIPSQFGQYRELKRLTNVLRRHDRLWQATPPKDSPLAVARNFALTSGRLHGKPLKVTAVAALDVAANKSLRRLALLLTALFNSPLFAGRFRFQALAAPFKVFWDGPINPLAEEIPVLRELNELDLEDAAGRRALLDDPAFQARFSRMWMTGKTGFGLARLKRILKMETLAFDRDFNEMVFHSGGPDIWTGETFAQVHGRYQAWRNDPSLARTPDERAAFEAMPEGAAEEPGFMLHLLREYDLSLRWWTVSANRDPEIVRALINHPQILPGFNDSGAHLTNMAFYDGNLRCLQIAQSEGLERVASQVRRLTREPAEFIGVDAGTMEIGDQADLTVIDPDALRAYDSEACSRFIWREDYEHEQMVNRSDGVVRSVLVSGVEVWDGERFTDAAGRQTLGRALRHTSWSPQRETLKVAAE
ncbi:MAG: amidohydrolase family protein [Oceanicaulis sp.]|nr:amidohydrolase family protein [Oceanicaulis sp.]